MIEPTNTAIWSNVETIGLNMIWDPPVNPLRNRELDREAARVQDAENARLDAVAIQAMAQVVRLAEAMAMIFPSAHSSVQIIPLIDINTFLPDSSIQSLNQSSSYLLDPQGSSYGQSTETMRRPSMPILHTRASFPLSYDSQHEHSPLDSYSYSTSVVPRQDSVSTCVDGVDQCPKWNRHRSQNPPTPPVTSTTTMYEEGGPAYNFGSLQPTIFTPIQSERLQSSAVDNFSSLNMNSLHLSLPTQTTATSRQLPVPHLLRVPIHPHSSTEIPNIRPLNSPNTQCGSLHGVHSRNAVVWSGYEGNTRDPVRPTDGSHTQEMLPTQYTTLPPSSNIASSAVPEPFGYQISPRPSSCSSDASPTAPTSDNLPNHPTSATRYTLSCHPAAMLPPIAVEERSAAGTTATHQYGYSDDVVGPQYDGQPSRHQRSDLNDSTQDEGPYSPTWHRHEQQQQQKQSAQYDMLQRSAKSLRRRTSSEQQKRSRQSRVSLNTVDGKR
ncbi:hypothetical protein K431DRAFT_315007 [Polychaeton citri CBS 116435]|uniref:Uncharacterized protein n=1 Tax=Polychaeton citri CBS 116435 TaxID=1314669 RepID=A0A9P4UJT5_9PEZI|nr:hypothetical protein K431DRAFT_315007 [Polychaeton citri CBS 116435]